MSWSRKDIVADIEQENLDIDINLPYWELRSAYTQSIYHRALMGNNSRNFAKTCSARIPPDSNKFK